MEIVGANLHPANGPAKADNQKYEVAERLLDVGFRWFGTAARMRMVGADDGESFRLRLVDAAAAANLREIVDGRDLVAARRVVRAIAAGDGFEDGRPVGAANQQSAAFVGRVTPRVRDDRRQRFAIDSDVRQPGPR